jgi:hypothetical protein
VKDHLGGRTLAFEVAMERTGHSRRADRVPLAGGDQHRPARKAGLVFGGERNQWGIRTAARTSEGFWNSKFARMLAPFEYPTPIRRARSIS